MAMFTALLDANVLYNIVATDLILEFASTGLFRACWSDGIHDEWMRNVAKNRSDIPADAVERRRMRMDQAFPDSLVTGYAHLIGGLELPDPDDRHVLAAAIAGRADVIVTYNQRDFPATALAPFGIEAQHPDEFLNHQRTLDEGCFIQSVRAIRARLRNPPYSADHYIDHLRSAAQLQVVAAELAKVKALT